MLQKTFAAEVTNGQLQFRETRAELEGQRVLVTLGQYPSHDVSTKWLPVLPPLQPLQELDIEQDVSFRMLFRWETVVVSVSEAGSLRPCVILPDETTNE